MAMAMRAPSAPLHGAPHGTPVAAVSLHYQDESHGVRARGEGERWEVEEGLGFGGRRGGNPSLIAAAQELERVLARSSAESVGGVRSSAESARGGMRER